MFKSEPGAYSYDDLVGDGVAEWDGVRNFKARNYLRDEIQEGDGVLFYHSSTDVIGVVGTARVVRSGYPDHTAWDSTSEHPDPRSTPERPVWYMVDIAPAHRFRRFITRSELKEIPELQGMVLLRASRLSVQPVTEAQWQVICRLGDVDPSA